MQFFARSIVFALVLALTAGIPLGADDEIPRTLENGRSNFYEETVETALAPATPARGTIEETLQQLDPRVGIEIYVEIPVHPEAFTADGTRRIYNILRSPGTMAGIEYYSASRGEMRTFYEESYAIASPDETDPIPDPLVQEIPDTDTIYAYQRDLSFGRNVQRLEYTRLDDGILMLMENETTMVYKVVPLVRPGNLRTLLLVRPAPERGVLEFYGNLAVRVPGMFGLQERARNSFYNRIVALHDWFVGELVAANLTTPN